MLSLTATAKPLSGSSSSLASAAAACFNACSRSIERKELSSPFSRSALSRTFSIFALIISSVTCRSRPGIRSGASPFYFVNEPAFPGFDRFYFQGALLRSHVVLPKDEQVKLRSVGRHNAAFAGPKRLWEVRVARRERVRSFRSFSNLFYQ